MLNDNPVVLSVAKAAYAAGILDGEGSISVSRRVHPQRVEYRPDIRVEMSSLPVIQWLRDTGYGSLGRKEGRINSLACTKKPLYLWWLNLSEFVDFLPQIIPFLVEKKGQAVLILELAVLRGANSSRRPVSTADRARRDEIYAEIKRLNGRPDKEKIANES